jgi:hypothetical protein
MSRRDAALKTMEEVGGALVSIALVLCAVFVPTAFLGGISGQFFQQFAVTIAVATAISCFCSLTLSPALASQILTPHERSGRRRAGMSSRAAGMPSPACFNRTFDRLAHGYAGLANFVIRHSVVMILIYVVLIGSAGWLIGPRRRASSRRRTAATSSSPCNCRARPRWRAPPRSCARSSGSRWTRRASSASPPSPASRAPRTQAGNAAALFPGVRRARG